MAPVVVVVAAVLVVMVVLELGAWVCDVDDRLAGAGGVGAGVELRAKLGANVVGLVCALVVVFDGSCCFVPLVDIGGAGLGLSGSIMLDEDESTMPRCSASSELSPTLPPTLPVPFCWPVPASIAASKSASSP